jgi:hypothetical protein
MARAPAFKKPSSVFSAADLRRELRQSQKKELAAKIKKLRGEVSKARADLVIETRKAKSRCLADLRAKIARLTQEIAEAKAKLAGARSEKRHTKLRSCGIEAGRVRAERKADLEAKRKALAEEMTFRDQQRRTERTTREREGREKVGVRQESDQEVIDNIEAERPELAPVFRRHKKLFRSSEFRTRTEAFWEWAKENPEEIAAELAASVPADDEYLREMAAAYGQPYEEAPF